MDVSVLGMSGYLLACVTAARESTSVEVRGTGPAHAQVRRIVATLDGIGVWIPFGVAVSLDPPGGSPALDLPIALALIAVATGEPLPPSLYATGRLASDGRLLAHHGDRDWVPVVGRLHHAPVDVRAERLPPITASVPVTRLAQARRVARELSAWPDPPSCAYCAEAARNVEARRGA